MSDNSKGPAAGEYPIRALIKADAWDFPGARRGSLIQVREVNSTEWESLDPNAPDSPYPWYEDDLILNPTPEQIAEERAKAGLPPLETPQASPEPVRAEGPDPLVEALDVIEKALHTGVARSIKKEEAIYSDAFSALMRLRSSATLSRTQGAV